MINWSRVAELRDEIGAEDFEDVVELFLSEVEEGIENLRGRSDQTRIQQDLHFLKGSALSLGFQSFADLCQTGEALSGSGAPVDVGEIITSFDQSRAMFVAELPNRSAD
jgi:histidine phosphotransfer protein HptB